MKDGILPQPTGIERRVMIVKSKEPTMDAVVSPGCAPDDALASIPLIDGGMDATGALLLAAPERLAALVACARRH